MTGGPGLGAAEPFYEQGGTAPSPVEPPATVELRFTVDGAATAALIASRIEQQLVEEPNVRDLSLVVSTAADADFAKMPLILACMACQHRYPAPPAPSVACCPECGSSLHRVAVQG